jgi:hypothetical protein
MNLPDISWLPLLPVLIVSATALLVVIADLWMEGPDREGLGWIGLLASGGGDLLGAAVDDQDDRLRRQPGARSVRPLLQLRHLPHRRPDAAHVDGLPETIDVRAETSFWCLRPRVCSRWRPQPI